MKIKILFLFLLLLNGIPIIGLSQSGSVIEKDFMAMRNYTISIGTVIRDSVIVNKKKTEVIRFASVGSGLVTYVKYKDKVFQNIITAGHVIKFFTENKRTSIFLRPSWSDTIKTTDYFGTEIPLFNPDKTPNFFLYPSEEIDLGCIVMFPAYIDSEFIEMNNNHVEARSVFPINSMTTPFIGQQVWIWGYPSHIENNTQNQSLYNISTFKPGYLTWKPSPNMISADLNHISLVESNATFGNSGGPVFSFEPDKIALIGILVGGYDEMDTVYINNKPVVDPVLQQVYLSKGRSGVSIIEKAEYVKKLNEYVESKIQSYK
ncbi:MAG: hypothetical protein SGI96_06555 [Bacteroidota bacterium]|nr:hypothetical protein [Bacteroidota bacterium]